jgi:hypothetical protein
MPVGLDIVVPKLIALGVGIRDVGATDPIYFAKRATVTERRLAQGSPVLPAATADHIVDGGERELLVIEVAVLHGRWILRRPGKNWGLTFTCQTHSRQISCYLFNSCLRT